MHFKQLFCPDNSFETFFRADGMIHQTLMIVRHDAFRKPEGYWSDVPEAALQTQE